MVESANLWKGDDLACFGALDRPGERAALGPRECTDEKMNVGEECSISLST
jgi:hypothetical protein